MSIQWPNVLYIQCEDSLSCTVQHLDDTKGNNASRSWKEACCHELEIFCLGSNLVVLLGDGTSREECNKKEPMGSNE